jgi:hypothetical protein
MMPLLGLGVIVLVGLFSWHLLKIELRITDLDGALRTAIDAIAKLHEEIEELRREMPT